MALQLFSKKQWKIRSPTPPFFIAFLGVSACMWHTAKNTPNIFFDPKGQHWPHPPCTHWSAQYYVTVSKWAILDAKINSKPWGKTPTREVLHVMDCVANDWRYCANFGCPKSESNSQELMKLSMMSWLLLSYNNTRLARGNDKFFYLLLKTSMFCPGQSMRLPA